MRITGTKRLELGQKGGESGKSSVNKFVPERSPEEQLRVFPNRHIKSTPDGQGYPQVIRAMRSDGEATVRKQGIGYAVCMRKEKATLAGGCFWGMEEIIRGLPGVIATTVGYTGGKTPNPDYKLVCTGTTGHAEAIEIEYDADETSFEALLDAFFRMHDPTTLNRQHNDIGAHCSNNLGITLPIGC